MERRAFLGLAVLPFSAFGAKADYPAVKPNPRFVFPRDHGAHPEYRVEWWYVTGWLAALTGPVGFQITFFRARPEETSDNPSKFNPRQILFAHAALSDPKRGRLAHDQRAARAGFSLAHAELERTGVWIDDWRLQPQGAPAARGELLLQPAASQCPRQAERQGRRRHRMARSRVVERLHGARSGGLGLVRHQSLRRRFGHGFPDASQRG